MATELPKHGPGAAWPSRRGAPPPAPLALSRPLCASQPRTTTCCRRLGCRARSARATGAPGLQGGPLPLQQQHCLPYGLCIRGSTYPLLSRKPARRFPCLLQHSLIKGSPASPPGMGSCPVSISRSRRTSQLKMTLVTKMMPTGAKASTATLCERCPPQPFPVVLCHRGGASRCP